MKKIFSLVMSVAMLFGAFLVADAKETYSLTLGDMVSVYVNGEAISSSMTVSETDKIKLAVEDESVVAIGLDGKYYPVNKYFSVVSDLNLTDATMYSLGIELVDGAQVRVGNDSLSDEGKLDSISDSGLRFLATCNYTDTIIADDAVEFGMKITAEGSDEAIYVKAKKFQDVDKTVFTAAVTNLHENNYNRKYTATAYAFVPMYDGTVAEFVAGEVTRSVYQVSVGILKQSSAEFDGSLPYTIDDAVKAVLCAYVNQSGIRLTYSNDGNMSARLTGKGAYTGDLYFDVMSSINDNGSTHVVIEPLGEADGFFNMVTIPVWWKEYIRINNNNSVAVKYISNEKIEDGVLEFDFTIPSATEYTFDQEDNVTIVSEITKEYIKGYKEGSLVTYDLEEAINVMGLAQTMEDVVPGSVILVGYNTNGKVSAVELLATLGLPINPKEFEENYGVYDASDGSSKYKNIVSQMFSKSGSKLVCQSLPDTTKTTYRFESSNSMCYRVGIAMDGEVPVITATGKKISTYPSIFESTAEYCNYVYLRYNSETERVKECVFYCVPKNYDFTGDGEYSDIFSLDDYRVIIE